MAYSYEFLIERAEQAAREATGPMLDNVRERALRAEAAWRVMAERALAAAKSRELVEEKAHALALQSHAMP